MSLESVVPAPTLMTTTSLRSSRATSDHFHREYGTRHAPPQCSSSWPPPETTSTSARRISRTAMPQWRASLTASLSAPTRRAVDPGAARSCEVPAESEPLDRPPPRSANARTSMGTARTWCRSSVSGGFWVIPTISTGPRRSRTPSMNVS